MNIILINTIKVRELTDFYVDLKIKTEFVRFKRY